MPLRYISNLLFGKKPEFVPDLLPLRDCKHCRKCVTFGACNRLTVHLIEHHQMEENHAYSTVHYVFERVAEHRKAHSRWSAVLEQDDPAIDQRPAPRVLSGTETPFGIPADILKP